MNTHELHAANLRLLFAPIARLIDAEDVSEILINGPHCVYVERAGKLHATPARFADSAALLAAVRAVAQYAGRGAGPDALVLEARLPNGSRIEAVLPPAAPEGPIVCIRRFTRAALTLEQLVHNGGLHPEAASLLERMVEGRRNLLVAGGTGSGKTSLLGALARHIGRGERVVAIEDARELQLPNEHVVQLEARPADAQGRGAIGVRELFKATLRLRPDRIVLGEIRGAEALELIQAMTSGHSGCLSTIHASSPKDALARLETMALMSDVRLPLAALRAQIGSAVHAVVQTARMHDGSRVVHAIVEVEVAPHGYALRTRYARDARPNSEDQT